MTTMKAGVNQSCKPGQEKIKGASNGRAAKLVAVYIKSKLVAGWSSLRLLFLQYMIRVFSG